MARGAQSGNSPLSSRESGEGVSWGWGQLIGEGLPGWDPIFPCEIFASSEHFNCLNSSNKKKKIFFPLKWKS